MSFLFVAVLGVGSTWSGFFHAVTRFARVKVRAALRTSPVIWFTRPACIFPEAAARPIMVGARLLTGAFVVDYANHFFTSLLSLRRVTLCVVQNKRHFRHQSSP